MSQFETHGSHQKSRLNIWSAAFVIARRDFQAILFSRAFLFFLLGPVFLLSVGALSSGVGSQIRQETVDPEVGIAMSVPDTTAMLAAHGVLAQQLGGSMPPMVAVDVGPEDGAAERMLEERRGNYAAIVTGTPAAPIMTGTGDQLKRLQGKVALVAATAEGRAPAKFPEITTQQVATSGASENSSRVATAQIGPDAVVPADHAVGRHGAVQSGGGEGQQDHRSSGGRDPDGRGLPRQAVRNAGRIDGWYSGVGIGRRRAGIS